ncbi:MAG: FecR family protein [Gemmatimonas sp.]|uniref:FecR family protein n=1 Tax=Gemmatimonas sp. TaxID=1962908 RepID=UPI00391F8BC3
MPHDLPLPSPDASDAEWAAFARYVTEESPPAEVAAVEAWLAARPLDARLAAFMKARARRIEAVAAVPVNTESALAAVRQRIADDAAPSLRVIPGGAVSSPAATTAAPWRRPWRLVGFAAAAGLAAVIGLSQFGRSGGSAASRAYRTAVGQRDSVRLPDGSTVVLAPGSILTVASGFGEVARDVTLEGAAYFDVAHDEGRPFTVRTATADIRDIGTAFSVKTVADGGVAVAVTHGIVALGARASAATPVELQAGDRGIVHAGAVAVTRGVVTSDDMAWTQGALRYRDASLAEVRADVRRWYGIDLRVLDSALARRTITASFDGASVAQVIETLALTLGASVEQRGDTVLLQLRGAGAATVR